MLFAGKVTCQVFVLSVLQGGAPCRVSPRPKEMWHRGHWRPEVGYLCPFPCLELKHLRNPLCSRGSKVRGIKSILQLRTGASRVDTGALGRVWMGGLHSRRRFTARFFNPKIPLTFLWRRGKSCHFVFAVSLYNGILIPSGLSAILKQKTVL